MSILNGLSRGLVVLALGGILGGGTAYANEDTVAIQTIILEAQGESLEGQIAVGETIRKRAVMRNLSHSQVCTQYRQYSAWNDSLGARNRLKSVSPEVFQRASRAWALSDGSRLTKGATHYHTLDVHPYWAKGKRPCLRLGNHLFYNNVK